MYCEKCNLICDDNFCPDCGTTELRQPDARDICLLTVMDSMFGEMLADILREHKVPFERRTARKVGIGAFMGSLFERCFFYVPYAHYHQATELVSVFFEMNEDVELQGFEEVADDEFIRVETEEESE